MTSGPRQVGEPVLKRPFDFVLALIGLLLSSPLWAVISLAIYLEDRGPAFFTQERCGRDGRLFTYMKFRTMRLPEKGRSAHSVIYLADDPRVTRIGKLLRVTALDELPELLSILKGEMSFVGPRPLPFRIEVTSPYGNIGEVPGYETRSRVRPGLTGLAQVCAPKSIGHRRKFRYDALYVRRMSFWLDLKLILLSFWMTFRGRWERRGRKA